jgi:hypothetical protein
LIRPFTFRLLWPLLTSHGSLLLRALLPVHETSPGTTRFFLSIYLLHLFPAFPCSYWTSACLAVLSTQKTLYEVSVRQARDLPALVSIFPAHPASFRFHLAMDTLAFGYVLPTTGRTLDFHQLETCAAGRTTMKIAGPRSGPAILFYGHYAGIIIPGVLPFSYISRSAQRTALRLLQTASLQYLGTYGLNRRSGSHPSCTHGVSR